MWVLATFLVIDFINLLFSWGILGYYHILIDPDIEYSWLAIAMHVTVSVEFSFGMFVTLHCTVGKS